MFDLGKSMAKTKCVPQRTYCKMSQGSSVASIIFNIAKILRTRWPSVKESNDNDDDDDNNTNGIELDALKYNITTYTKLWEHHNNNNDSNTNNLES